MNKTVNANARVIGFDSHPDTFTAALITGLTPAAAVVEKTFNKVPLGQLDRWATKHTTAQDLFVLEASGNSFQVVRSLAAIGRRALVLESCQIGKLKEAHANNDRISAVRIGKAYLAGTAKEVWVPDAKTQERRVPGRTSPASHPAPDGKTPRYAALSRRFDRCPPPAPTICRFSHHSLGTFPTASLSPCLSHLGLEDEFKTGRTRNSGALFVGHQCRQ